MKRTALLTAGMVLLAQVGMAQSDWQVVELVGAGRWGVNPEYDFYLYSVALSGEGATAIVGGVGEGAARVFERSGGVWSQRPSIPVGSDAIENVGPLYSAAISADGNTAVVGGPLDDSEVGAAWVFTRTGDDWSQQGAKLIGVGDVSSRWLGVSAATSADGSTVVGGQTSSGTGAAWVFARSEGRWSQQGDPLVGDGLACHGCFQGFSVGVSGDGNTIIVGAPYAEQGGAAWVFTRSDGVWTQQGLLRAAEGSAGSSLGHSVALSADGSTAIVGGPGDADLTGAAWVFTRSSAEWSQQAKLVGSGAAGAARMGTSVAILADGNTAIVGGPGDSSRGAAWIFTRADTVWTQEGDKLVGHGSSGSGWYQAQSVAMSADGTTLLVGVPDDGEGGTVWVYSSLPTSRWVPVAAHVGGANGSQWRSDLGLLNPGSRAASVEVRFHGRNGVLSNSVEVPAGAQSILSDVVGQLGAEGQGALEIITDRPFKMTARTYNQVAPDAGCLANGTQGQDYPVIEAGSGLEAGQSAFLPALVEDDGYRTNIGVVNMGEAAATVLVELFDGAGTRLIDYTVRLAPGRWRQEIQPFRYLAGETAMSAGYAQIAVQSGSGVLALASIIDNVTNDPTTITMQR